MIESWLDDPGRLMSASQAARRKAAQIGATAAYQDRLRTLYAELGARI
jgi:hypothetical protein